MIVFMQIYPEHIKDLHLRIARKVVSITRAGSISISSLGSLLLPELDSAVLRPVLTELLNEQDHLIRSLTLARLSAIRCPRTVEEVIRFCDTQDSARLLLGLEMLEKLFARATDEPSKRGAALNFRGEQLLGKGVDEFLGRVRPIVHSAGAEAGRLGEALERVEASRAHLRAMEVAQAGHAQPREP